MIKEASFGMGCFWKPDVLFSEIEGVVKSEVGYMGGDEEKFPNPSYKQVCSGKTGYAEIVHVVFDSDKVSYEELLKVFWNNHNPTTMNRQGLDIGNQYRSVIFYYGEHQRKAAIKSKNDLQSHWGNKIVTEITRAGKFFIAEDYHQKYLSKNRGAVC